MPRTRECDYCGADIEPGTGTMLVHNNGSTTHFCSSKCENNADLGREARNLEWTESGRTVTAAQQADKDEAEAAAAAEADAAEEAEEVEAADADEEEADAEADADDGEDDEETEEAEA